MFDRDPARHFALAPAGYIHLEQAVYRLARAEDVDLWRDRLSDTPLYERLGSSLHIEDLSAAIDTLWGTHEFRPRYAARLASCFEAEQKLRERLRHGLLTSVMQRRFDGKILPFEADYWAQPKAPAWFLDGSCFVLDPTMAADQETVRIFGIDLPEHRGFEADLFVREAVELPAANPPTASNPSVPTLGPEARGERRGRPKSKMPAVEQALRDEYPDGPPRLLDRKIMLKRVGERLGTAVSEQTLDRARKTAWL